VSIYLVSLSSTREHLDLVDQRIQVSLAIRGGYLPEDLESETTKTNHLSLKEAKSVFFPRYPWFTLLSGTNAIKKFTPSLRIPSLGVYTPE
jgi:hypothetical protein